MLTRSFLFHCTTLLVPMLASLSSIKLKPNLSFAHLKRQQWCSYLVHLTFKLISVASKCSALKTLVQFGDVDEETKKKAEEGKVTVYSLAEVEKMGEETPADVVPPEYDDIATISYTSGT